MKVLGIDYGNKKIGLALGDSEVVSPLTALDTIPNHILEEEAIYKIASIVTDEGVDIVVIGLPLLGGQETNMSEKVRLFVEKLKKMIPDVKIDYIDEFKTSKEAVLKAVNMDISKKRRKSNHSLSACEIVKRYYE